MVTNLPNPAVELANDLRPLLLRLARRLRQESHALGLTATQVTLLASVNDRPGIGVLELAEREGVSAASISQNLRRLENNGLVARTRIVGGDRRRVGLRLTPEGIEVVDSVKSRRTAWLASRLALLDPREQQILRAAIAPLANVLDVSE